MLQRFSLSAGHLVETGSSEATIEFYTDPDEAENQHLVQQLCLDAHTLASALDPNELGRVEFEPDHIVAIIKRPKQYSSEDNFLFKINSVGLFLFPEKLIIVLRGDTISFEGRMFQKIASLRDLLLRIICRSIHHFEDHLKVVSLISDELEQEIAHSMENRHLLNMFTIEKSLVYYLNAISSNGRVLDKLKNSAGRFGFSPEELEFLDDVLIENAQCHELANTYSQVLSNLMDARVSIVSNNLNLLMKTLTLVMITIMLPTLVLSIFSMNVKLPIDQETSLAAFWGIIALAALSAGSVLVFWRLKKW